MAKKAKKSIAIDHNDHDDNDDNDNDNDDNDNDNDDNDNDDSNDDDNDNDGNEEEEEDDDDNENDDDDDDDNNNSENDKEASSKKGQDGLADMMSKILNQNVGKKIPVLAKRKLQVIKDDEDDKITKNKQTMLKLAKRIEREKQLVIPDESNIHYERQLRKLATRGVVALFNAIAKAKKPVEQDDDDEDNSNSTKKSIGKKSIDDVRNMTQENFLKMLKNNNNLKSGSSTVDITDNNDNNNDNANKLKSEKWAVLSDNYLTSRNNTLKNWDRDDDDDDSNDEKNNKNNHQKKKFKK